MIITIKILGQPIQQNRPRFVKNRAYSDQEKEKKNTKKQIIAQMNGQKPLSDAISIQLYFSLRRPKSHFGTGKNSGILKKSAPMLATKKPDLDNYIKFILDCMNTIVFEDDSQIVQINACKFYTESDPHSLIILSDETYISY